MDILIYLNIVFDFHLPSNFICSIVYPICNKSQQRPTLKEWLWYAASFKFTAVSSFLSVILTMSDVIGILPFRIKNGS